MAFYPHSYSPDHSKKQAFRVSTHTTEVIPEATLDPTLRRIDKLANEDVEMQDLDLRAIDAFTILVLDTNVLLSYLDVIKQFASDVEVMKLPVKIVIPGAVILELDNQKNRNGLAWFARRASAWLLEKMKERRTVKGQAEEETCKLSGNWKKKDAAEPSGSGMANDLLIFDCCGYFKRKGRVLLCSADKNLCIYAESNGIPTVSPPAHDRQWRSMDIAAALFSPGKIDLSKFGTYKRTFRHRDYIDRKQPKPAAAAPVEVDDIDMAMEVDDEDAPMHEVLLPSHALDLLHYQVVDHFTIVLLELAGRVRDAEQQPAGGVSTSAYAPAYTRKPLREWSVSDCLAYLDNRKKRTPTSPKLEHFLSLPYAPGARRGHDWPTMAWLTCVNALEELGNIWSECELTDSVNGLRPHLEATLSQKMRPTGT